MTTVKGTYNEAKVFTDALEETSRAQIETLCSQPYAQGAKIRMMPEAMILRKGSVRALPGEKILIPINMRDGSLVCVGEGNDDWNCSAPHGAGRIMSRKDAKSSLKMEDFKKSMEGIWSSTVCEDTIDEAPMAYKGMDEIKANIGPTADIVAEIKPIYSFKAAE